MFLRLLLLFTLVPVIELMLLIEIGKATSFQFTLALILLTGFIGASLARWQGRQAVVQLKAELAAGRPPAAAAVNGILILVAGAVLLTPGLLTDIFGFSLLIPPVRAWMRARLVSWFTRNVKVQTFGPGGVQNWSPQSTQQVDHQGSDHKRDDPNIIDVEFERMD